MSDTGTLTLLVGDIRLPLGADRRQAGEQARRMAGLGAQQVHSADIHRLSVDARHGKPVLVYIMALTAPAPAVLAAASRPGVRLAQTPALTLVRGLRPLTHRPVICGFGPAGIFAAYLLAREGYRPIVLEQGPAMEARAAAVAHYQRTGSLAPYANIQFGEGGAGAFSDGKLTTRISDPLCGFVTEILLRHGAPAEIAIRQKPHIGTDLLRGVIAGIRQEILRLGGEVLFETRLCGLQVQNGRLRGVVTSKGEFGCDALILAPGHSARQTFDMLADAGVTLHAKPFSVGFRAEHLQTDIETALYHAAAGHPDLPKAEYQLACHVDGRGVYTFCMCPGGQVVAAASEPDTALTNGMSRHARDGQNANAAVVVEVKPADFGNDARQAIAYQRQLERTAFVLGGGSGMAPAQDAAAFLAGRRGLGISRVRPSYPLGVRAADFEQLFGAPLTAALRAGMRCFDKRIRGYAAPHVVLTGPETRTSSPVRLARDADTLQSTELAGLYPAGEGAGWAGGIMSAAVDGLRAAKALIAQSAPSAV